MTRLLVLDASFAFHLVLPGPRQTLSRELITEWKREGCELFAPTLWLYEITSALCKAVRFSKLTPDEGKRALVLAHELDVQLIPPDDAQTRLAFDWTLRLNRGAAYDSFYLALAETLRCELWTADQRLHHAVGQSWVHFVGGV
jgi:predicted nucleic acid-binding protein